MMSHLPHFWPAHGGVNSDGGEPGGETDDTGSSLLLPGSQGAGNQVG